MGQAVMQAIHDAENIELVGAYVRAGHAWDGKPVGHVVPALQGEGALCSSDIASLLGKADVVIDFSLPEAAMLVAEMCADEGVGFVSGTTGLSDEEMDGLVALGKKSPVLWAANMSLGVNLLAMLTEQAASLLDESFDIEVLEMHHRHKKDAPSGTALALAGAVAEGRGKPLKDVMAPAYQEAPVREAGKIGMAVLRGGGVVGDHDVIFASAEERVILSHRAGDRSLFAKGAVQAARFVAGQEKGFFSMRDVLKARLV